MKHIIFLTLGFFIWQSALSQGIQVTVTPAIATTSIDSIKITSGSTILSAPDFSFDAVTAGVGLYGIGILANVTVVSVDTVGTTDTLTISVAATRTVTLGTLQFGVYADLAYSSGDWLGLPFKIYEKAPANINTLITALITDNADTVGSTDIIFFRSWSDTLGADNAAVALTAQDAHRVAGYIALTGATDLGAIRILEKDNVNVALAGGNLYGRLIARMAQHVNSSSAYQLHLKFR